jgi:dTDP-glucose 4,6-dehydratase
MIFKGELLDAEALKDIFKQYNITDVIHLAAESHVDRSIISPLDFVYTNVVGTVSLLNTAKEFWKHDFSYENVYDGT